MNKKHLGLLCILLGIACLLGAVGFLIYNRWEADAAADSTQLLLEELQTVLTQTPRGPAPTQPAQPQAAVPGEMPTVPLGDYDCLGVLSIPVLELELPVLTDWSYQKLKKAPCHYYGSYNEKDFVIAAHNYQSHFGRLSQLQPGDLVVFTDVGGVDHGYKVVLLETLPPEATEEMITSGFELSLYTCTPGGGNRVTVRCAAVK